MTTKTKKVTKLNFWVRIVIEKDDPGYHAFTPSLKGIHMGGDTPEEALKCAREAIELYLLSMLEHGDPIPIDLTGPKGEKPGKAPRDIVYSQVEKVEVSLNEEGNLGPAKKSYRGGPDQGIRQ